VETAAVSGREAVCRAIATPLRDDSSDHGTNWWRFRTKRSALWWRALSGLLGRDSKRARDE